MDLSVKNVKTFRGHDGEGFNATLYMNGKRVAYVVDLADGGECQYRCMDRKVRDEIEAWVKTLPPRKSEVVDGKFPMDLDCVVADLVDRALMQKKCKRHVVWMVKNKKGQGEGYSVRGEWMGHEDHWREFIQRTCEKRGETLMQILNEGV